MKNYVHANKLGSRGGTYRTETWKALKTVLHAAQFGEGSATLADLNAELGVSTRLSAAARGEEGLRARRTRRDKLPLRPALVFWHSSEIAQIDSFAGKTMRKYQWNGEAIQCFPCMQLIPDEDAVKLWLASPECREVVDDMIERFGYKRGFGERMFMKAKCPCLFQPRFHSCVCVICTQMACYLIALGKLRAALPPAVCSCEHCKHLEDKPGGADLYARGEAWCDSPWELIDIAKSNDGSHIVPKDGNLIIIPSDEPKCIGAREKAGFVLPINAIIFATEPSYWSMHEGSDRGVGACSNLKSVLLCPKQRIPELDVSWAPNYAKTRMYSPDCAIGAPEYDGCDECGWDVRIGEPCPRESSSDVTVDVDEYLHEVRSGEETKRGEGGDDEAAEGPIKACRTQLVRKTVKGVSGKDLWEKIKNHATTKFLDHEWKATFITVIEGIIAKTFDTSPPPAPVARDDIESRLRDGPTEVPCNAETLLIHADFAAQIQHEFDGNVTCSTFAHSNCEVVVASHSPKWVLQKNGTWKREITTDCWFFIGGTVSKFKEADSHAHNASLLHLLQYYKSKMPNLRRIIMCTDGCGGQYKGRFNFKYIARYTRHEGISVRHIFAATAHFKGFHDALGKLIAKIYEKAEKYHKARSETSYELKKLVAETIQGEVETVGSGEMAINQYFVRYLTSVENDPRIAESETIYVKRPVDWDTNSLEAVSGRGTY